MIIKEYWNFDEFTDKGIDTLPLGTVFMINTSQNKAKALVTLVDKTGIDANTTIADLLVNLPDSIKTIGTYGKIEYDYPANKLHMIVT